MPTRSTISFYPFPVYHLQESRAIEPLNLFTHETYLQPSFTGQLKCYTLPERVMEIILNSFFHLILTSCTYFVLEIISCLSKKTNQNSIFLLLIICNGYLVLSKPVIPFLHS